MPAQEIKDNTEWLPLCVNAKKMAERLLADSLVAEHTRPLSLVKGGQREAVVAVLLTGIYASDNKNKYTTYDIYTYRGKGRK